MEASIKMLQMTATILVRTPLFMESYLSVRFWDVHSSVANNSGAGKQG